MQRISIIILILILGLAYAIQNEGVKQIIHPEFNTADLSIPKSMNFQGMLYEAGEPVDTTMNMWFGIYDLASGGSLLFEQAINNVVVTNGWFTVTLVNIPNSVFPISGPTRYLEVKAPATGPALEPRIPLLSVGYSYHSLTSDSAKYLILPCTLQAAIAYPEAILNIGNDGDGIGIKIDEASYGISIDSARSFGVYIRKSAGDGVYVRNADEDGVFVNNVVGNGLNVHNASNDGVHVRRADSSGVYVDAARYGMRVDSVGMNGIWISKVGGNGFRVDDASVSGALVSRVDNDGFRVDSAGWRGFYVSYAGYDGLYVSRSGYDGVYIYRAGDDGVSVDSAANVGFYVNKADTGLKVNRAKNVGAYVDSTGIGYLVDYTQIGLKVSAANHQGVYVDNTGWGGVQVFNSYEDGVIGRGWWSGGRFIAAVHQARGILVFAYNSVATDTAIQAYGRGYATGGWYTGGLKGNQEAPCIISPDLTIIASGTGRLNDGKAEIRYPEVFVENTRTDIPVRLSVTPIDDPTGLLYAKKDGTTGFDVTLKIIPGWAGDNDIAFDWIAIGTLKEYETSPEAKAEWDEMMNRMEERRNEIKKTDK